MIALVLALAVHLSVRLRSLETVWVVPQESQLQSWDPRLFRILSVGHLPAAVDWFWLKSLVDPAANKVPVGMHANLYYNLDLLTDLDPAFFEAYYVGANLLSVIRDDFTGARDLLLKGNAFRKTRLPQYPPEFQSKYWRGQFTIPMLMAYVFLFDLNDMPSARAAFREAAATTGAPPYLAHLSARLEAPGGEYEVSLKLLNFLITTASDPRVRENLEKQRDSLYVGQFVSDLNRSFAGFSAGKRDLDPSRRWKAFLEETRTSLTDPWGGQLTLDSSGRIITSTPHQKVFGLE